MKHALQLLSAALLAMSMNAQAAVSIAIKEVGGDVVVSGSGSINNLGALTFRETTNENNDSLFPFVAGIGSSANRPIDTYTGLTGPLSIGDGFIYSVSPGTSSQPFLIIGSAYGNPGIGAISLPAGYVEGTPLFFKFTIPNLTIGDFRFDADTYEWTWGTPDEGDSVTLCVGDMPSCVLPEPPAPATATPVPSLGLFGLMGLAGVIGAAGVAMTRRRKQS